MRDNRFRAWDTETESYIEIGFDFRIDGNGNIYRRAWGETVWDRTTTLIIEQFTGLKDWYAGDIIQKGEIIRAITVDYEHGLRFMLGKHILCKQDALNGTKIGDIHTTPKQTQATLDGR